MENGSLPMWLTVFLLVSSYAVPSLYGQRSGVTGDDFMSWQGPCSLTPGADICSSSSTIALGGLFPIHGNNGNSASTEESLCDDDIQVSGFERMEAMRFAIDEINKRRDILPGILLAYEMRDTCLTPDHTNQQTVRFVQREDTSQCTTGLIPISGVVGAASSGPSIAAADLLRIFHIPQISYASTSATLSEDRYRFFLRTVPPDIFQAKAIVGISHALGIQYPGVVSTEGAYGRDGAAEVVRELQARQSACVAANSDLGVNKANDDGSADSRYESVLTDLTDTLSKNSSATVAFSGRDATLAFMRYVAQEQSSQSPRLPEKFTWFATDSWIEDDQFTKEDAINATRGTLGVAPTSSIVDRFRQHFLSLNPRANIGRSRNPWLSEFWNKTFGCNPDACNISQAPSATDYCVQCLNNSLRDSPSFAYSQNSKIPFVIDAVYAFARALDSMQRQLCGAGTQGLCKGMMALEQSRTGAVNGDALLIYLKNLTFTGEGNSTVAFDSAGDLESAVYNVYNIQKVNEKGMRRIVGTWEQLPHDHIGPLRNTISAAGNFDIIACSDPTKNESTCSRSRLTLNASRIEWRDGTWGYVARPVSRCSALCSPGFQALPIPSFPRSLYPLCCWQCQSCSANMYVRTQRDTCQLCPDHQYINRNRSGCVDLEKDYFSINDRSAIACIIVASIGLALVVIALPVIVFVMDILHENSALRFFSMLSSALGAAAIYILVFINLAPPSSATCTLRAAWSPIAMSFLLLPFLMELIDIFFAIRREKYIASVDAEVDAKDVKPADDDVIELPAVTIPSVRRSVGNANDGTAAPSDTTISKAVSNDASPGQIKETPRRRSLFSRKGSVFENDYLTFWVFLSTLLAIIIIVALCLAIDEPRQLDDVIPNEKWFSGCSVSAAVIATLVLTMVMIASIVALRFYFLVIGEFVPWTLRMAAFMAIAVSLLVVCLLIVYTQLSGAVIREAMILLCHLAIALAVNVLLVMDLMRTLAPDSGSKPEPGRLAPSAQQTAPDGVHKQVIATLSQRSLLNAEQRRNRKVSHDIALHSQSQRQPQLQRYWTADSGNESQAQSKPASYLVPPLAAASQHSQSASGLSASESGFCERPEAASRKDVSAAGQEGTTPQQVTSYIVDQGDLCLDAVATRAGQAEVDASQNGGESPDVTAKNRVGCGSIVGSIAMPQTLQSDSSDSLVPHQETVL
ncbi:metabotropic glutamate receptor 8-like [Sycon ciliatum]|uniref:metabotropic glutamate receptor 8-like n=1 Tax=Sycon ciliatum TaxID=27933 RepID=UPI0031F6C148